MTISEVSKKYELSEDTLRYYEKIGLLPHPKRKGKNRDYDQTICGWIDFIQCMRKSGLEIAVLKKYVALYYEGDSTIEERKTLLLQQREKLLQKRDAIDATIKKLNYKIENYNRLSKFKLN